MSKTCGQTTQRKVDGDWRCAECSNLNYAFRSRCNRCQFVRPLGSSVFNFSLFSIFPSYLDEPENTVPMTDEELPSLSPFQSEKCMKEQTELRPILGRKLNFAEEECADWKPKLVSRDSAVAALPSLLDGVKRPYKEKEGDWVCLSCKNLNFAFRRQCNKCRKAKASYVTMR